MSFDVTVRWARYAALGAALAMMSACATAPVVRTRMARQVSLQSFHTFAFVAHPGTDRGKYKSITTQQLERDVGRELTSRGYVRAGSHETPDLLVNFEFATHDRIAGGPGPVFPYCGWGWGWGWGGDWDDGVGPCGWGWGGYGYPNDMRTITRGALTVELIDRSNRAVVWSGTALEDLDSDTLDHPGQAIDQAITEIFKHFPVGASAAH